MVKYGRIVYAFSPSLSMLENVAKRAGPRPILLSYFYLRKRTGLKALEKWRKFSKPWTLFIDSGVYTLQTRLGIQATGTSAFQDYTEEDWADFRKVMLAEKDEIDAYVNDYTQFLKDAEGLYDVAIEMDVDNLMGVEYSDLYYEQLLNACDSHKLMRVWHASGRDYQSWLEWTKNPNMTWMALEGGTTHNRDPKFYNKMTWPAKKNGKKVHILALTIPRILRSVPIDTTDSSTFVNGGRYGTIKIPGMGEIGFSTTTDLTKKTSSSSRHYTTLNEEDFNWCLEYFKENGFTFEELTSDKLAHYNRIVLTLEYYDKYIDLPFNSNISINNSLF